MKRLLLTLGILLTTGCTPVPQHYKVAARAMAVETCNGMVTQSEDFTILGAFSGSEAVRTGSYLKYDCLTESGTVFMKLHYRDIPLKYFKEAK